MFFFIKIFKSEIIHYSFLVEACRLTLLKKNVTIEATHVFCADLTHVVSRIWSYKHLYIGERIRAAWFDRNGMFALARV